MADQQENQPEVKAPAAKKGGGGFAAILPWLIAFAPQITAGLVFVVFLAVVLAIINSQKGLQPPDMSGEGGSVACSSWASAPPTYQMTFTAASKAYGISPALVGAIFMSEHGGNISASPPWASSPVGASGPFQFMPATWSSNQVDGDKDGKKDIQNLTDASFAAARLLQALISNNANKNWLTTDEKDIKTIGACYNWGCGGDHFDEVKKYIAGDSSAKVPAETQNYMTNIWTYFQNLNVGCKNASAYGSTGNIGYTNSKWNKSYMTKPVLSNWLSARQSNPSKKLKPTGWTLHWTGGNSAIGAYGGMANRPQPAFVHFMVDDDGTIYQLIPLNLTQSGSGIGTDSNGISANNFTLGIEIVGVGQKDLQAHPDQKAAVVALINEVSAKFGIEKLRGNTENFSNKKGIFGHFQTGGGNGTIGCSSSRKTDPGTQYTKDIWDEVGATGTACGV